MADENKKPDQEPAPREPQAPKPPAGEAAAAGPDAPDVAALEGQIAELTDRLLRAHAEMDNLRKRTERDKEDMAKYAISKFAREVLSVGDNLQRAIEAVPAGAAEEDPALKALIDGVSMTEREFLNVLERHGVKRIDPAGEPFNPHQHQAMTEMENPEVAPGTVVQVYQPGYILEDRVLRPAMVVVAKGGAKPGKERTSAKPLPRLPRAQRHALDALTRRMLGGQTVILSLRALPGTAIMPAGPGGRSRPPSIVKTMGKIDHRRVAWSRCTPKNRPYISGVYCLSAPKGAVSGAQLLQGRKYPDAEPSGPVGLPQ